VLYMLCTVAENSEAVVVAENSEAGLKCQVLYMLCSC